MTMRRLSLVLLLATTACSMTPKLTLPAPPVAQAYPIADEAEALPEWRGMFGDPRLQRLIALSLDSNRDLRIAARNAEATYVQLRVQRAQALPAANAEGGYTRQRQPASVAGAGIGLAPGGGATGFTFGQFAAQAALTSFELDLFGRLHAMNAAALQRWLASVEARRAVRLAVIGAVAEAYWNERLAEEQLGLARATLNDGRTALEITRQRRVAGQASGVDLAQAEGLVRQAHADFVQRERERIQATNALILVVGASLPADLPPALSLLDQPVRSGLAAGTPSDLLTKRPDILQAEHELRAANADIGAARAVFFPRISLTGAFGFASLALDSLFRGANRSWSYTPAISVPIFRGGELRGNLELAKLRASSAVATYEKAIQIGFREVADGLAAQATYAAQRTEQGAAVAAAERRTALAAMAYAAGQTSRLELLDAQRATYTARQAALVVRRDQLAASAALYRALGGETGPPPRTSRHPPPARNAAGSTGAGHWLVWTWWQLDPAPSVSAPAAPSRIASPRSPTGASSRPGPVDRATLLWRQHRRARATAPGRSVQTAAGRDKCLRERSPICRAWRRARLAARGVGIALPDRLQLP